MQNLWRTLLEPVNQAWLILGDGPPSLGVEGGPGSLYVRRDARPHEAALWVRGSIEAAWTTRESGTWFDVRAYGAVGDGTADDRPAIQRAIDAAGAAGGGTVLVPAGKYRLRTFAVDSGNAYALQMSAGVTLLGTGTASRLVVDPTDVSALYARSIAGFALEGITIECATSSSNADALKLLSSSNVRLSGLTAAGFRIGFQLLGCRDVHALMCASVGARAMATGEDARGFSVGDHASYGGSERIRLMGCTASEGAGHGFVVFTSGLVCLEGCIAERNAGVGFRISSTRAVASGCEAMRNLAGFDLVGARAARLLGCGAEENRQFGFRFVGACQNICAGCIATGNGIEGAGSHSAFVMADGPVAGASTANILLGCSARQAPNRNLDDHGYDASSAPDGANTIIGCDFTGTRMGPVFARGDVHFQNAGAQREAIEVKGDLRRDGLRIVSKRRKGWKMPTGKSSRSAFDTATVSSAQLAERLKALLEDLEAHGLIGR